MTQVRIGGDSEVLNMLALCGELGGYRDGEPPAHYLRRLIDRVIELERKPVAAHDIKLPLAETFSQIAPGQKIVAAFPRKKYSMVAVGHGLTQSIVVGEVMTIVTETAIFEYEEGALRELAFIDPMDAAFTEPPRPQTEEEVVGATWRRVKSDAEVLGDLHLHGSATCRALRNVEAKPGDVVRFKTERNPAGGSWLVSGTTAAMAYHIELGELPW